MNSTQESLYLLLDEVDELFERSGCTYYLAGGAALGAVRNGGFLPWDDDVDLYVTRDEWHRFIEYMNGVELPENRGFITLETDTEGYYRNPVGRYVDTHTTVMMQSQLLSAKACGQMVEFFIFDPLPIDEEKRTEHRKAVKTYCELLTPYFVCSASKNWRPVDFDYEHYSRYLKKVKTKGLQPVLDELLDIITATDEADSDAWCMCWGMRTLIYGKELFGKPKYVRFENKEFPVPAKQEEVARVAYGDSWMYVPGKAGQIVHGLDSEFNTPFKEYTDIYLDLIDREKVLDAFEKRKRVNVEKTQYQHEYLEKLADVRLELYNNYFRKHPIDADYLRSLLDSGEYDSVNAELLRFFDVHANPRVKYYGLLADVPDDFISVACDYLIYTGSYYRAGYFIRTRMNDEREMSDHLKETVKMFDYCRALSVAVYDHMDPDEVERILSSEGAYPDLVDSHRAALWVMQQRIGDSEPERLLDAANASAEKYPNDGEILRFAAYALAKTGRMDESRERYTKAVLNTRNGFVWKEAAEVCGIDPYELDDNNYPVKEETDEIVSHEDYRMKTMKKMLFEIDEICRANGLKYSLSGSVSLEVLKNGTLPAQFDYISIAMTYGDIDRLINIVNSGGTGSRVLEYIENNLNTRSLLYRYVDKESTLINVDEYGFHTYYGIFIPIIPVRSNDIGKGQQSLLNRRVDIWRAGRSDKRTGIRRRICGRIVDRVGKEKYAADLYERAKTKRGVDKWEDIETFDSVRIGRMSFKKRKKPDESVIDDLTIVRTWDIEDVCIDGKPVMISPMLVNRRVRLERAHQWVMNNEIVETAPYYETINDNVTRYLNEIDTIFRTVKRTIKSVKPQSDIISNAWNTYLMSKDVVDLRRVYDVDMIKHMSDALQKNDLMTFIDLAEEYILCAARWVRKDVAFAFDDDILDMIRKCGDRITDSFDINERIIDALSVIDEKVTAKTI